jgi:methionine synthase II (cobalamin-independent)
MRTDFHPKGLPVLIGSLPLDEHVNALELVWTYTPEIPLWVQLPVFSEERMLFQFSPGLPGFTVQGDRFYVHGAGPDFEAQLLAFYDEYVAVGEGQRALADSRFVLTPETAAGFFVFLERLKRLSEPPVAVKGQITGPITLSTGLADQDGRAIFYDDQVRDAAVKIVAQKARWQTQMLAQFGCPAIVFLDEPALAGFGSSAFISISRDEILGCLGEAIEAIHLAGGLAGIHVCANADWSVVLESGTDIVSFDAFGFFDKFILYPQAIRRFIASGGILAWGIVPTLDAGEIDRATTVSLVAAWESRARQLTALGIPLARIIDQALITPSCGTGSLSLERATKVLRLTREVSDHLRRTLL